MAVRPEPSPELDPEPELGAGALLAPLAEVDAPLPDPPDMVERGFAAPETLPLERT